jgi:hypothetical protein
MRIFLVILSIFMANFAHCQTEKLDAFVNINKQVAGVDESLQAFKSKVDIQIGLPRFIPASTEGLYLHFQTLSRQHYIIDLSEQVDCNGANYCNIGSVTAEMGADPIIHYDNENREITVPVTLAESIKGYYTPGYALGSSTPPQVSFRCKNVLYTVSWRTVNAKDIKMTLIRLAEATIVNADVENELDCK